MDRWMRSELRTFPGGIAGARVGEASSHLVNGVAKHQKISTRLKSITIHLASPTTIACETQERTKERKKRVNVDRGWYALCSWGGRLTKEGKTCFEPSRLLSRKYKAVPRIVPDIKDHRRRHYRLSGESTKLRDWRPNSTKNFYVALNNWFYIRCSELSFEYCSYRERIPIYVRRILRRFTVSRG